MKKIIFLLLIVSNVSIAQMNCTPGGNWHRCGRAMEPYYTPELAILDSFCFDTGIPVNCLNCSGGGGGDASAANQATQIAQFEAGGTANLQLAQLESNTLSCVNSLVDIDLQTLSAQNSLFTINGNVNNINSLTSSLLLNSYVDTVYLHKIDSSSRVNAGYNAAGLTNLGAIQGFTATAANFSFVNAVACTATVGVVIPSKAVVISGINAAGNIQVIAAFSGLLGLEMGFISNAISNTYISRSAIGTVTSHTVTPAFSGFIFYLQ